MKTAIAPTPEEEEEEEVRIGNSINAILYKLITSHIRRSYTSGSVVFEFCETHETLSRV